MNKIELVKHLNTLRKNNKNVWVYWNGIYNDKNVSYKAYKTWVQYLTIDGLKHSSLCDCKPTQYIEFLKEVL
jgi:hypothetical protein